MDFPTYDTLALSWPMPQVLQVTLNRPEVGNALNTQMAHDMLDLWRRLEADGQDVRCVVLTGAGDRIFCGGGDLKERNGMTRDAWNRQHELFERMYWQMGDLPQPLIGAINGHTYAGGLEMLLMCDFAYASDHARFAFTEVAIGIMPGAGGTQNLPRAIGQRRAKEMLMTARPIGAEQALDWGLVNAIHPQAEVLPQALAAAAAIAANAPLSIRQVKKSVRYGSQMEVRTAYRFEIEAYNHLVDTEDRLEGVLAFNEKRKPVFKGR
jgi:enoyl-CoA hydratase/carnithine racemase